MSHTRPIQPTTGTKFAFGHTARARSPYGDGRVSSVRWSLAIKLYYYYCCCCCFVLKLPRYTESTRCFVRALYLLPCTKSETRTFSRSLPIAFHAVTGRFGVCGRKGGRKRKLPFSLFFFFIVVSGTITRNILRFSPERARSATTFSR